MALIIAIYEGQRPVDGLETGWDEIERALARTSEPLPMLRSVDPYEVRTLSRDDVLDLMVECDQFLPSTTGPAATTLARLSELTRTVLSAPGTVLQMVGD